MDIIHLLVPNTVDSIFCDEIPPFIGSRNLNKVTCEPCRSKALAKLWAHNTPCVKSVEFTVSLTEYRRLHSELLGKKVALQLGGVTNRWKAERKIRKLQSKLDSYHEALIKLACPEG